MKLELNIAEQRLITDALEEYANHSNRCAEHQRNTGNKKGADSFVETDRQCRELAARVRRCCSPIEDDPEAVAAIDDLRARGYTGEQVAEALRRAYAR